MFIHIISSSKNIFASGLSMLSLVIYKGYHTRLHCILVKRDFSFENLFFSIEGHKRLQKRVHFVPNKRTTQTANPSAPAMSVNCFVMDSCDKRTVKI